MIRFHTTTFWVFVSIVIAIADFLLPPTSAVCVAQIILQLIASRWLVARRFAILSIWLMVAIVVPAILHIAIEYRAAGVFPNIFTQGDGLLRAWSLATVTVSVGFIAEQQRVRRRRLVLRQQLQRNVRRRTAQVKRINEALRREVARRQATQQLLMRTETHLQSLAQRMQLQVLRKDTDGVITYANEAFCRGVGRSISDVIGSTDGELYPPATAAKYRDDDAQVMASGIPVDHVESHPTADGKTGWVQVFKAPEYDSNDKCTGIQMVFWDVTDTYRRTAELRRSEARKRAIFEAAREAVMLVDDQGRIVEANPAAQTLLGAGAGSLAGCLIESVAVPESTVSPSSEEDTNPTSDGVNITERPWVRRAAMQWRELPTSERREMTVRREDGFAFPAEISVHPIPLENAHGLAVFIRDVTLRHQAIRALREAKLAAEEASRIKSEFMASVSHEIRTPLGGITGSAELLSRMEALPARANQYVSMIRQSAELLSAVIGDILDFSSIEAGRLQIDPAPTDLYQCVGEAFRCLATRAADKDVELVLSIQPGVPREVLVDAKRLRQVVINLAGNAIKFTPRGHVLLRLACSATEPGEIQLEMIDSGIGIPLDRQAKIFEPFEQGDSGTTRRYGGTGLGLSISDKLVRRMGGRIEVTSRPGHGSTFRCTLPLPASGNATNEPVVASRQSIEQSIAVEIGNALQRKAVTETLIGRGFRVECDAKLIIADIGGIRRDELEGSKLIWLSRVDDEAVPAGRTPNAILFKPVLPDELLTTIGDLMAPSPIAVPHGSRRTKLDPPGVDSTTSVTRNGRLLVVDDSEVNRTVIREFLVQAGYVTDIVCSGADAILATQGKTYDCVLMDLQMPEMDGIETMQQIVRQCDYLRTSRPPFVALTAHATDEHQSRCLAAGMKSFLVKPIEPVKLIETIAKIVAPQASAIEQANSAADEVLPPAWQAKLLKSSGGDRRTMVSLAAAFVEEVPQLCASLQAAIAVGNIKEARRAAHTLKSCLKYVAPPEDWQVALEIENAAQVDDLESSATLVPSALAIGRLWTDRLTHFLKQQTESGN